MPIIPVYFCCVEEEESDETLIEEDESVDSLIEERDFEVSIK